MMQTDREIAVEILRRMELERKRRERKRARIMTLAAGLALTLSVTGLSLIPWSVGTGPPIRAEASMLGGDPAAGLYMLLGVIAVTSGVVVTVLCLRKREKKKTESKNSEQKGDAEQRRDSG